MEYWRGSNSSILTKEFRSSTENEAYRLKVEDDEAKVQDVRRNADVHANSASGKRKARKMKKF